MDNKLVVSSNWSHIAGCTFSQSVQQRAANLNFIKPHLNELVDEEKSILLSREKSSEQCELYLKLFPRYKLLAVSFVCNVVKVEIFHGHIKEYLETIYGVVLEEPDDQFKSYRYDVEVDKSSITDLTLRFLTDSSDVCIFGIMLHTAHNPNDVTILPSAGCVNFQNVEDISQNSTRQRSNIPDKSKTMLELITKLTQHKSLLLLDQHKKEEISIVSKECNDIDMKTIGDMFACLKSHIDQRFQEMELQLKVYLKDMEQRQNQKLDRILKILEK